MTPTARTRLVVATTAALAGLALTGCAAGGAANRETIYQKNPGTNAGITVSDGSIELRDVSIVPPASGAYPTGASVPLSLMAFNNTANPISITGVRVATPPTTAAGGSSGTLTGTVVLVPAAGAVTAPSAGASQPVGRGTASAGPSGSSSASASASGSASASASGSASAASGSGSAKPGASGSATPSAGASSGSALSITIPAGGYLRLSPDTGAYLALTNLSQDLSYAGSIGLVFTFSTGDSATVQVSFGNPSVAPSTTPTQFPVGG